MPYSQVASAIRQARRVVILAHVNPDADAIGSACALALGLKQLGISSRLYVGQDKPIPDNLLSIPYADKVELFEQDQAFPPADVVISVDCGSLSRTGTAAAEYQAFSGPCINIDHYDTNPGYGDINLVDPARESTTVVLYELFRTLGISLDREIAHGLYAGLMTDTGSFRWGSRLMHTMAAELMDYGLDPKQIAVDLVDLTAPDDLQMTGEVLSNLQIKSAGSVTMAVLQVPHHIIAAHSQSAVEKLVDFVRSLDGTNLGVVYKEMAPGYWNGSLRSREIDCSAIAMKLGGGGHVPAAGFAARGTAAEVIDELLTVIERECP